MAGFLNKLRSASTGTSTTPNNASPKAKKDEPTQELTPLEKMLQNAAAREDGTDKFFGLENFGNTCYCNSIVQALFYSEQFRDSVVNYPPFTPSDTPNGQPRKVNVQIRPPMNGNASPVKAKPLTAAQAMKQRQAINAGQLPPGQLRPEDRPDSPEYKKKQAMIKGPVLELAQENTGAYGMDECTFTGLKDIFLALIESNTRTGVLSPQRFLEIFKRDNELFRNSMHQDAHEFYGLVLNDVISNVEANARRAQEREDARNKDGLVQSVENALGASSAVMKSMQPSGTMSPGTGWVHDIFEGVLTSETKCLTCETASQRDETFLDLSIDLEEHSSVTSCLKKFSAEEMLCERNKFHCDRCGGLQEAEKRMKIKKLPKVLALHLKRFKYTEDYSRLQKLFHRVVYPYHLRMFNTTDDADDPDRLYELYAVVVHIGGNAYHGHYVSVIKTPDRGWLLFDDEMVEPVDKHFVRNFFGDKPGMACAYVLFYQETTFEKVLAEQEAEGLEEVRLVSEKAGLALEKVKTNGEATSPLTRQATTPISPFDDKEPFAVLNHAQTAPGASRPPPVPPIPDVIPDPPYSHPMVAAPPPGVPASNVVTQEEAKNSKEDKKLGKKEQKAAEKARKAAEKEQAKIDEKERKEKLQRIRDARKNEEEELQKALAASKALAATEAKQQKKKENKAPAESSASSSPGPSVPNRTHKGSKSLSRKSMVGLSWLGGKDKKEKDKDRADDKSESNPSEAGGENGDKRPSSSAERPDKQALKERFSFGGIGRKKSMPFH